MSIFFALVYSIIFLFGICWGSFLNVVAYRIAFERPFLTARSMCPLCGQVIAWYDNLPVISWFLLRGRCRHCHKPISFLYLLFELLSGVIFVLVAMKLLPRFFPSYYVTSFAPYSLDIGQFYESVCGSLFAYAVGSTCSAVVFFSALIVATITDIRAMVIPQIASLWLVPAGIIFSFMGLTGISYGESALGAFLGYGVLWLVASMFKALTKKDGLGVGDMEFLSMIGAFIGPVGVWFTIMAGSVLGMIIGGAYIALRGQNRMTRIPFGPFLALGAAAYYLGEPLVMRLFTL